MPAHCAGMLASCRQRGTERRAPIPSNRKILRVQAGSDNGEANRRSLQRAKDYGNGKSTLTARDLLTSYRRLLSERMRPHCQAVFPTRCAGPETQSGLPASIEKNTERTTRGREILPTFRPLFKLDRNLGEAAHSKSSELIHKIHVNALDTT